MTSFCAVSNSSKSGTPKIVVTLGSIELFYEGIDHGSERRAHQTPLGAFENAFAFAGSPHRKDPHSPRRSR
jgi:hypothetical protein